MRVCNKKSLYVLKWKCVKGLYIYNICAIKCISNYTRLIISRQVLVVAQPEVSVSVISRLSGVGEGDNEEPNQKPWKATRGSG